MPSLPWCRESKGTHNDQLRHNILLSLHRHAVPGAMEVDIRQNCM